MASELIPNTVEQPVSPHDDPLYHFTRVFLKFFQTIFSERNAGDYRWVGEDGVEDETLSEISVTDESPVAKERVVARPLIVTQRAEAAFTDLTLDSMKNINIRTSEKETMDLVSCVMFIHAIAKNRVEASKLGWILLTQIRRYRAVLKRAGFHDIGRGLRLGTPTPPGSLVSPEPTPEMRAVTCICPFAFRYVEVEIPISAPKARDISEKLYGPRPTVTVSA